MSIFRMKRSRFTESRAVFENQRKTTRDGTTFSRSNISEKFAAESIFERYFGQTDHFLSQLRATKKERKFPSPVCCENSMKYTVFREIRQHNFSGDRKVAHGKTVHRTYSRGSERFAVHTYTSSTRRYGPRFRIRRKLVTSHRGTQRHL